MNQELLRNEVQAIKDEYGMSYAFISKKTGISQSMVRMWLKGERNLGEAYLKEMEVFASKHR